jgi:hypothetical protein
LAASIQLVNSNGKLSSSGDVIQYIYTDSQHQNPLNRIAIAGDNNFGLNYDKEKYKEMLLDATETVVGDRIRQDSVWQTKEPEAGGWHWCFQPSPSSDERG